MSHECPLRTDTLSLAARFTSTSVQTAPFGSPQAISQVKIGGQAQRKRASPRPRKSRRTGTYSFAENCVLARLGAKRPFARYLNANCTSTTSSPRDNATSECGRPALAIERSLGPLLREPGHLRDHRRKDPGIPNSETPRSNYETRQAIRPQHHPSGNRHAAPDPQNSAAPWLAGPTAQFL
jgi:hypothetical protein